MTGEKEPQNSNETESGQPRHKLIMIKWEYLLYPYVKQNITVKLAQT